jgi:hypothetical protein
MASCGMADDEVFILTAGSYPNSYLAQWQAHGFTDENHRQCLLNAIQDYAPWHLTPINMAYEGIVDYDHDTYDLGTGTEKASVDTDFPQFIMSAWRKARGYSSVNGNQSLTTGYLGKYPTIIYSALGRFGGPLEFQINNPDLSSQSAINADIQLAITTYKASEVELEDSIAAGGKVNISESDLQFWSNQFPSYQQAQMPCDSCQSGAVEINSYSPSGF